jgi:mono/diheme cytochrome c family protein
MSQPNDGQDHLDYRETDDITEVHASVLREHAEPRADSLPIPTWLGVLCTGALCWAGVYVGMFHGGFNASIYNEYESSPAAFFPLPGGGPGAGAKVEETLLAIGAKTYSNCAACHQVSGAGTPAIPPLAGSEWVDGSEFSEKRLIAVLLKGVAGAIAVKGQTYNGAMPPWESLTDKQIAGVSTYIRQSFGNKGTGDITPEMVKAVRKEFKARTAPWSEAEIKAIPVDAKIEGVAPAAAPAAPAGDKPAETPKAADGKPAAAAPAAPATPATPAAHAAHEAASYDLAASIKAGQPLYMATCMACHQMTGAGLPGAFPPLAKTHYVNGDARRLVAIALKGIVGAMTVEGKVYATGMPQPDTTFPQLKEDKAIADVLNYVRNNFGNKNDAAITPEFVAQVRKEFAGRTTQWTEAELLNFPPAK